MKRFLSLRSLLLLVPLLLLIGVPMATFAKSATPAGRNAAHSISIVGAWKGHLTVTPTSNPSMLVLTESSSGFANFIGPFQLNASELDSITSQGTSIFGTFTGRFTIHNSRGDSFSATYTGLFSPISATAVKFHSFGQITGGTGRLSGATGPFTVTGVSSSSSPISPTTITALVANGLTIEASIKATISLP